MPAPGKIFLCEDGSWHLLNEDRTHPHSYLTLRFPYPSLIQTGYIPSCNLIWPSNLPLTLFEIAITCYYLLVMENLHGWMKKTYTQRVKYAFNLWFHVLASLYMPLLILFGSWKTLTCKQQRNGRHRAPKGQGLHSSLESCFFFSGGNHPTWVHMAIFQVKE